MPARIGDAAYGQLAWANGADGLAQVHQGHPPAGLNLHRAGGDAVVEPVGRGEAHFLLPHGLAEQHRHDGAVIPRLGIVAWDFRATGFHRDVLSDGDDFGRRFAHFEHGGSEGGFRHAVRVGVHQQRTGGVGER